MARECKDICYQTRYQHIFTTKQLSYDEGSYCRTCEIWIKQRTNSKLDVIIECIPNEQYHDIEGKRRDVRLLYPIKKLVKAVKCICCGTQARGKTHASNNKLRNKIFNTFKPEDRKTLKELGLKRAKRAVRKKDNNNNINYGYEESVFNLRGTGLE